MAAKRTPKAKVKAAPVEAVTIEDGTEAPVVEAPDKSKRTDYVKVFVLAPGMFDVEYFDHSGNISAVNAELLATGWRVIGDDVVEFAAAEVTLDGSIELTYSAPVTLATEL